ncbi:putative ABC transport system ATP-binding protein [Streptacidiphilus sp. MAP12-33]|uniref:ABC transporter ATP-binding protein n=1 Tax=Streptacidiphilus sp. MAP12-33 TaxID=3156266 RepID=UPI0035144B0C
MSHSLPALRRRSAGAVGKRTAPAAAASGETRDPVPVITVQRLVKSYGTGEATVHALAGPLNGQGEPMGVDLSIHQGDFVAIMGSSGSGKSTLMNILGCLDAPTAGRYLLDGLDVGGLDEHQLSLVRNRKIGFIFQSFNLIPRTTAVAQVELPLAYAGVKPAERRRRALAALSMVGLADRADHRPNELSGGQQQRVAVARALVTSPAMLLADEPTGNLDTRSTDDVLAIVDRLNAAGRTVVVITHEDEVARHAKRVVRLVDGRVDSDVRQAPVLGPPPALLDPTRFAANSLYVQGPEQPRGAHHVPRIQHAQTGIQG